jgi:hypothetical protein
MGRVGRGGGNHGFHGLARMVFEWRAEDWVGAAPVRVVAILGTVEPAAGAGPGAEIGKMGGQRAAALGCVEGGALRRVLCDTVSLILSRRSSSSPSACLAVRGNDSPRSRSWFSKQVPSGR